MTTDADERLALAEERLGLRFRDRGLLAQALTHSSGKSETAPSNERLEFLGDSILGAVIARRLYSQFPTWDEGELTRVKSAVVSAATLAEAAQTLSLGALAVTGKGMSGRALPSSLLANVFEAVVAATYLDQGFDAAEAFILAQLDGTVARIAREEISKNWKSILQQYAQKNLGATPTYRVITETGPEHVKSFEVAAVIGERGETGRGLGRSKKEAEQKAAEATLRGILGADADQVREGPTPA